MTSFVFMPQSTFCVCLFGSGATMGGARRGKPPEVEESVMKGIVTLHIALIIAMGIYESKSTPDQPCGKGILHLHDLIAALVEACPGGEIGSPIIRKCLLSLVFDQPKLNTTIYNNGVWAGLRTERMITLMNHVRRLRREPDRLRQVMAKLNGQETQKLKALLDKIEVPPGAEPGDIADDVETETLYMPNTCDVENPNAEPVCRRPLKAQVSDVSMDSNGFPKMLQDLATGSSCESQGASSGTVMPKSMQRGYPALVSEASMTDATLVAKLGYKRSHAETQERVSEHPRPQGKARGKAKGKAKAKPKAKAKGDAKARAKAQTQPRGMAVGRLPAELKATFATKQQESQCNCSC